MYARIALFTLILSSCSILDGCKDQGATREVYLFKIEGDIVDFYFDFEPFFKAGPQSRQITYLQTKGRKYCVSLNGHEGKYYDSIGADHSLNITTISTMFSPNGQHLAYAAKKEGRWFVVLDGKEGKHYPLVGSNPLTFSPDSKRLAYTVLPYTVSPGIFVYTPWKVVVDDFESDTYYQYGRDCKVLFSPNSKHFAYVGKTYSGKKFVVLNGMDLREYDDISYLRFSPDSKWIAYIGRSENRSCVVVNDTERRHYVLVFDLTISPDSRRLAYIASDGSKYFAVIDTVERTRYDYISFIKFSPNSHRTMYVAEEKEKQLVIVDGKEGKAYEDIGHLFDCTFSPDSKRVAYSAFSSGEAFVVLDGEEGKHYSCSKSDVSKCIGHLEFSPDSEHLVYVVEEHESEKMLVVLDGIESDRFEAISNVTFSPTGERIAYIADRGSRSCVVVDGQEGKYYDHISGLVFSPDGLHVAYMAQREKEKKPTSFVVVDGVEMSKYSCVLGTRGCRIVFDSPHQLHYLALVGRTVVLVEQRISNNLNPSRRGSASKP
ncbi:MAG: hypothetical protein GWN33_12355 [Gammaproteobacteria bacterium]|nr:hypothetical protein [Deltaproteobacteria bacterium]NIW11244.1 hypothetical protein [Gammaproteobacteria bacterium]